MGNKPKHRFDAEEAAAAFKLLTEEEQEEYKGILLTDGIATASNKRLDKLESIAYGRLKEKNNE